MPGLYTISRMAQQAKTLRTANKIAFVRQLIWLCLKDILVMHMHMHTTHTHAHIDIDTHNKRT